MPDIEDSIHLPNAGRDLLVYGLHGSEFGDDLQDFADQIQVTFPLIDNQGTRTSFNYPMGVGYPYPRDIVIGKDLTVRAIRNSFDVEEMTALVEALLDE